jgi:hypothetical protein
MNQETSNLIGLVLLEGDGMPWWYTVRKAAGKWYLWDPSISGKNKWRLPTYEENAKIEAAFPGDRSDP